MKTCGECEYCDRTMAYASDPEQYRCMETGRSNTLDHVCDLMFRIHEMLGLKYRELFYVKEGECEIGPLQVDEKGNVVYFGKKDYVESVFLTKAINDPSLVVREGIKKDELELCKILGAKYATRDGCSAEVSLWSERPASESVYGHAVFRGDNGASLVAVVHAPDMFRWVGASSIVKITWGVAGA